MGVLCQFEMTKIAKCTKSVYTLFTHPKSMLRKSPFYAVCRVMGFGSIPITRFKLKKCLETLVSRHFLVSNEMKNGNYSSSDTSRSAGDSAFSGEITLLPIFCSNSLRALPAIAPPSRTVPFASS